MATCIKNETERSEHSYIFLDKADLDITDSKAVNAVFEKMRPDFCVNCAGYTAVDKAESEPEKAHNINVDGAKNLARACKEYGTKLIHISTDFVFDGRKDIPYTETKRPIHLGSTGKQN